ncbi:MAG: hypothetical protein GYB25_04710 [Rhodobacteraceae bacterium]|nr:hypothetical protein [Paracoccaceae bacterium]
MVNRIFTVAAVAAFCAPAAQAEVTFDGVLTFGYSMGELSSGGFALDVDTTSLRMDSKLRFSDNFDVEFGLGTQIYSPDGTNVDLSTLAIDVTPRYHFGNGWSLGAYYENADFDINNAGLLSAIGIELESYGLLVGYGQDAWEVEGFIGSTELDPLGALIPYDVLSYGLRGTYAISDRFTMGGHLLATDISSPALPTDLNAYSAGLSGFYDVNNEWTVFAGVSKAWASEFGVDVDAVGISIGGSYDLTSVMSFPATLSLEYVNTDLSASAGGPSVGADVEEFRFGITIPLGGKANPRPLNSHAYQVMKGGHNIVTALIPLH